MAAEEPHNEGQRERRWELVLHQHNQFNARMNFFLIAEAMLVGAAAQVLTSDEAKPLLGLAISISGIGLTCVWAYVNRRQSVLIDFRHTALAELAEADQGRPTAGVRSAELEVLVYGVPAIVLIVWLPILIVSVVELA